MVPDKFTDRFVLAFGKEIPQGQVDGALSGAAGVGVFPDLAGDFRHLIAGIVQLTQRRDKWFGAMNGFDNTRRCFLIKAVGRGFAETHDAIRVGELEEHVIDIILRSAREGKKIFRVEPVDGCGDFHIEPD